MELTVARQELLNGEALSSWGTVDYTVRPATNPIDDVPIVLQKGFYGIPSAYSDLQDSFADRGKHCVNPDIPRVMNLPFAIHPSNITHPHRLASRGTKAVIEDLHDEHDIDKFDLVVHSKGGRDVMWVANNMPELVRSVILIGSVGTGNNHIHDFIPRIPKFLWREGPEIIKYALQKKSWEMAAEGIKHAMFPHVMVGETMTIHDAQLLGRLGALRYLGINVGILELANDTLVPTTDTNPELIEEATAHAIFNQGEALHVAPITQADEVAEAVVTMLQAMPETATGRNQLAA